MTGRPDNQCRVGCLEHADIIGAIANGKRLTLTLLLLIQRLELQQGPAFICVASHT